MFVYGRSSSSIPKSSKLYYHVKGRIQKNKANFLPKFSWYKYVLESSKLARGYMDFKHS